MNKIRGFTLVELMVTLAIVAATLAVAAPSFMSMINSNRTAAFIGDLTVDMVAARAEAVRRSAAVQICSSTNGNNCNGTSWANGWVLRAGGAVIKSHAAAPAGIAVANVLPSGNPQTITFGTAGYPDNQFNFSVCIGGERMRTITINAVGRVSSTMTAAVCP